MKKYFETLGLQEGASQEEIQTAYERLSKELDPANNNNQDFFIEEHALVLEAYKKLSVTKKSRDSNFQKEVIDSIQNKTENLNSKDNFQLEDSIEVIFENYKSSSVLEKITLVNRIEILAGKGVNKYIILLRIICKYEDVSNSKNLVIALKNQLPSSKSYKRKVMPAHRKRNVLLFFAIILGLVIFFQNYESTSSEMNYKNTNKKDSYDFEEYNTEQSNFNENKTIIFNNDSADDIYLAVAYKNKSGNWISEGWYKVKSKENTHRYFKYLSANFIYWYAISANDDGVWEGNKIKFCIDDENAFSFNNSRSNCSVKKPFHKLKLSGDKTSQTLVD